MNAGATASTAPAERSPGAAPDDEPVIETVGPDQALRDPRSPSTSSTCEVRAGEIYGLLGPNGAGKTTTILMLLGLSEPTAGEARVLGLDPTRDPRRVKRHVGYLPDSAGFYGSMTGRQNLRYTARLNGLSGGPAEARIDEVLERVGLTDRADDRAETYSRGMRQRLGIADALVKDPSILDPRRADDRDRPDRGGRDPGPHPGPGPGRGPGDPHRQPPPRPGPDGLSPGRHLPPGPAHRAGNGRRAGPRVRRRVEPARGRDRRGLARRPAWTCRAFSRASPAWPPSSRSAAGPGEGDPLAPGAWPTRPTGARSGRRSSVGSWRQASGSTGSAGPASRSSGSTGWPSSGRSATTPGGQEPSSAAEDVDMTVIDDQAVTSAGRRAPRRASRRGPAG